MDSNKYFGDWKDLIIYENCDLVIDFIVTIELPEDASLLWFLIHTKDYKQCQQFLYENIFTTLQFYLFLKNAESGNC